METRSGTGRTTLRASWRVPAAPNAVILRWINEPVAVRGEGEAIAVAEALLADESDEVLLAA